MVILMLQQTSSLRFHHLELGLMISCLWLYLTSLWNLGWTNPRKQIVMIWIQKLSFTLSFYHIDLIHHFQYEVISLCYLITFISFLLFYLFIYFITINKYKVYVCFTSLFILNSCDGYTSENLIFPLLILSIILSYLNL
jgi:hypothetical protein